MNDSLFFRKLPFRISLLLIVAMATATIFEKIYGSEFAYNHVYGAWWFIYVWAILASLGILGIIKCRLYKNLPLMFTHLAFIVILVGAGLTKTFAEQGHVIITKNVYSSLMESDGKPVMLPFSVKLDTFYISYYPGTDAPADYTSQIAIMEKSGESTKAQVSMNKIYSYKNYRFYQSSFENDMNTSILRVNHDVAGVPVTYAGYFMFMLAMLWFLLSPQSAFRQLLKHPLLQKTTLSIAAVALLSSTGYSQTLTRDGLTIEKAQSEAFGDLWILSEGRIVPMFTFTRDFTQKIVGKPYFGDFDATQFFAGILFCPEKWGEIPLFDVENQELRKALNLKQGAKAALSDFYDGTYYKLSRYWDEIASVNKTPFTKEVEKLNDKIQLIEMLSSGWLLQIYPLNVDGQLQWLHPMQKTYIEPEADIEFVFYSLRDYYTELKKGDKTAALNALDKIKNFQKQKAGNVLPSDIHRKTEHFYVKIDLTSILFKINLVCGILSLLMMLFLSEKKRITSNNIFHIILILSLFAHTFSIGLRTYIAGRLPFSNGYETMILTAWCAMLISALFGRKIRLLIPFGLLLSGCTLLVAHIGTMNPKITPLVPVLSSPLLSIHVSVIMLSYTLFGFVALNALTSFVHILISKSGNEQETLRQLERNKIYGLICLYPAVFLLGAGIFIGAIWANVSWGRYWGWDPKEVWALITFMIYCLVFHRNIKPLQTIFGFHVFSFYAFASVLMTYFGVNYILGGMHSYAGEMQLDKSLLITVASIVMVSVFVFFAYLKYKKIVASAELCEPDKLT